MNRLLIIEDDDFAFKSIKLQLKKIGYTCDQISRSAKLSDISDIFTDDIDLVITDLTLPDSDCETTFKRVKRKFPFTPIIVLTGTNERQIALNMIQQGAQDYLVKGEFDWKVLEKSILYAIERSKIYDSILIEKQNLRAMINNTEDIIWSVDCNHNIILANNAFRERINKLSGKDFEHVSPSDIDCELVKTWTEYYDQALKGELHKMIWCETHNGKKTYEEVRFNLMYDKDRNVVGVSCFSRDITRHYTHLKMIKKQNDQLRQIAWIHSHDVRGPVASIMGVAHLFNTDDPGCDENIEILENLIIATNKLDEVIRKINSYTSTSWSEIDFNGQS